MHELVLQKNWNQCNFEKYLNFTEYSNYFEDEIMS